jgi:hypothetical protein
VIALTADTDALRVSNHPGHLNHGDLLPNNLLIGRGAGETGQTARAAKVPADSGTWRGSPCVKSVDARSITWGEGLS